MRPRRAVAPFPHRWVLALLTVLASFAFLTRQTAPVASPGVTAAVMGAMTGMAAPDEPVAASVRDAVNPEPGGAAPRHVRGDLVHSGKVLVTSSPNAPPAPHDHGAHCPFCFTSAFSLEAVGTAIRDPGIRITGRADMAYTRPALLALNHADARAPPQG